MKPVLPRRVLWLGIGLALFVVGVVLLAFGAVDLIRAVLALLQGEPS